MLRDLATSATASAVRRVEGGYRRADSKVASLGQCIGVSASGHERIEAAGGWSGGRAANEASKADAFGCAVTAIWIAAQRLCSVRMLHVTRDGEAESRAMAKRLLPAPGAMWAPGTIGAARAMWLRRQAWRAAFRSLTQTMLRGDTAAVRSVRFVGFEISDWGNLHDSSSEEQDPSGFIRASELASGFETLPPTRPAEQLRQARAMIWQKLGCILPRDWSQDHNTRLGQCARVKQAVLLWRVLAGTPLSDAANGLGYSPNYVRGSHNFGQALALFGELVPSQLESGLHVTGRRARRVQKGIAVRAPKRTYNPLHVEQDRQFAENLKARIQSLSPAVLKALAENQTSNR